MSLARFPLEQHPLQSEFKQELIRTANWWATYAIDEANGGFVGEITDDNQVVEGASKGVILNARILWFFSETAQYIDEPKYRACADRAFDYLSTYFVDTDFGGFYWELDAAGQPINTKKQVYAQAFVIYALSSYYQLTKNENALTLALNTFELVEEKAIDREREGYLEAFTREWGLIDDLRLSDKDLNFPKSQNTHLHVLEAYTRLAIVEPTDVVKNALRYNIEMFDKYMINRENYHLRMFLDLEWKDFSPGFTYGHDIEAAWLIAKALEALGDDEYTKKLTPDLIKVAETTAKEGIGEHGQVLDAYNFETKTVSPDTVWWVQAEAVVGFLYAYVTTKESRYLEIAENVWSFIKKYQMNHESGEWYWLSTLDKKPDVPNYKVGFWKCPYHNGRAMIEAALYLEQAAKQ